MPQHRNFIFGMVVHLDHIYIKFEYQGQSHSGKSFQDSWTPNLFAMTSLWYWCCQGHLMVKVTIILRSRSFWNQMVMCFNFYPEAGGWLSSECLSYLFPLWFCQELIEINVSSHLRMYVVDNLLCSREKIV